ncbi:MAG: GH25 family lysozyme [Pseudomonadota bacterium]
MTETVSGIDVSHWQGSVDWSAVKGSGVDFGIAKATEGVNTVDSEFAANWSGMGDAGILRGAYHFYTVGKDPQAQADHFMSVVTLGSGDLPPTVDIETESAGAESDANLIKDLHTFLDLLKQNYGADPFIYTGPGFWNAHFDDSFSGYPLWVAEYGVSQPKPVTGWTYWTIWQHSQTGSVPGVAGNVDLDTFNGGLDQLKKFLIS